MSDSQRHTPTSARSSSSSPFSYAQPSTPASAGAVPPTAILTQSRSSSSSTHPLQQQQQQSQLLPPTSPTVLQQQRRPSATLSRSDSALAASLPPPSPTILPSPAAPAASSSPPPPPATTGADVADIERQWNEFRRRAARETQRIDASDFYARKQREEAERIEREYEDMLLEHSFDLKRRQQRSLKHAASLLSSSPSAPSGSGVSNASCAGKPNGAAGSRASLPPRAPPAVPEPSSPVQQRTPLTQPLGNTSESGNAANERSASRASSSSGVPNASFAAAAAASARGSALDGNVNNASFTSNPTPSGSNRDADARQRLRNFRAAQQKRLVKEDAEQEKEDRALLNAVRLIERQVMRYLNNKLVAQRQLEMARAAADTETDERLGLWREQSWTDPSARRPKFELSNAVVTSIEKHRRAVEAAFRARQETGHAHHLLDLENGVGGGVYGGISGGNRSWIHQHLLRSADRFDKRRSTAASVALRTGGSPAAIPGWRR